MCNLIIIIVEYHNYFINSFIIFIVPSGRPTITVEKHVLTYLWFVGHQTASYRNVADRFGVTLSTLFNIITRVTDFLLSMPNIIRLPTNAEMEVTQQYYRNRTGFPGVIGKNFENTMGKKQYSCNTMLFVVHICIF